MEWLKDEWIAVLASVAILWVLGRVKPDWWADSVTIAVGWVFADVLLNCIFISGEKGAVHIPILGTLIQDEGYNYLAFLGGIIISSLVSAVIFVKILVDWLASTQHPVIMGSAFVGGLVFLDLEARYYGPKKRKHT